MTADNFATHYRSRHGFAMEGSIARWYAKITQKSMWQYRSWAKKASDNVALVGSVLEVAPGQGYLSIELAKLGDYRIIGMDISHTMVKIAQEKAGAAGVQVEFRQGDAHNIPFADDSFDFAICTAAFKNFPEPLRVLKTNGKVLIIDLRRNTSSKEIKEGVDAMGLSMIDSIITKLTFKYMLLKTAYTADEIRELASRSKFAKCRILEGPMGMEISLEKR